ncbi:hypothetical protein CDD81_4442 [Ophiocordyceps australis]|uniref:Uncharacterized protein n=1 Tax=Ophiocordyceps australis TaxID=1399860 RepID=A0A2C5YE99_9HYPO|nr:hypothetical protein CDD81_4442 [Ophiocordyceps australis]
MSDTSGHDGAAATNKPQNSQASALNMDRDFSNLSEGHDEAWTTESVKGSQPDVTVKVSQMPARAAAAIRRLSRPFRPADQGLAMAKTKGIEIPKQVQYSNKSYESLDSVLYKERARNGLADPAKLQHDGHAMQFKHSAFGAMNHNSRDTGSSLPFPLISLPEAALLQHMRRERGEEDHTDLPGSFAAKARSARSGTISTTSSKSVASPMTTMSPFSNGSPSQLRQVTKPGPSYQGFYISTQAASSVVTSSSRPNSLAILGNSNPPWSRELASVPWQQEPVNENPSFLHRVSEWTGIKKPTKSPEMPDSFQAFIRAEERRVAAEKDDIEELRRAHLAYNPHGKQELLFYLIAMASLLFPPLGLLAICGRFDSTISWCTHGRAHALTGAQRKWLKRQMFAEAIVLPVLISILSVYYGMRSPREM